MSFHFKIISVLVACIFTCKAHTATSTTTHWEWFDENKGEHFFISVFEGDDANKSMVFEFNFEDGLNMLAIITNRNPTPLIRTNFDPDCYSAELLESFEQSKGFYLLCFRGEKLLFSKQDINVSRAMPDYIIFEKIEVKSSRQ